MHSKIIKLILVFSLISCNVFSQGKLLLIGGGSEKSTNTSWNAAAYKWAVDKSANKRVAIIAYGTADNWMIDYFKTNCGAVYAANFNINSEDIANSQLTYDSLITYDVIYYKGGDQYNYYSTYKNTKVQQATTEVYNRGGVICGTSAGLAILSNVLFTAENGSAYSDACLENPKHSSIVLKNDFFNFFPGYVFDSHFTIRSRNGRLLAFMANWKFSKNEDITGMGVDEMTAMAVDENKIGTVYGIGSVTIYQVSGEKGFEQSESKLIADSVKVTQLIQGCSYNFNTRTISGFSSSAVPSITQETGNYTIFASGSDNLTSNITMLQQFVNKSNQSKIVIITGSNDAIAQQFKSEILKIANVAVAIHSAVNQNAANAAMLTDIATATKMLFVANNPTELIDFVNNTANGQILNAKIRENNFITAFVGDNSRLIGKVMVDNYLVVDAAYKGKLKISNSLNLLKTTVLMPNYFLDADYYENLATSVPYALVTSNLKYGIWLNKNNFIQYSPATDGNTYINAYGSSPVVILKNNGGNSGLSVQSANGNPSDDIPQFSGFESMTLSLTDVSTPYKVGNSITVGVIHQKQETYQKPTIYSDKNQLSIQYRNVAFQYAIFDLNGRKLESNKGYNLVKVPLRNYPDTLLVVQVVNSQTGMKFMYKIIN